MKKYIQPIIEILEINEDDIICTSGTPINKDPEHEDIPHIDFPF